MAVDDYDDTTGRPIFLDSGAPDTGVDPTAVGIYAAEVGNRIVKANLAALDAYAYKRAGLSGHALDTKLEYIHDGSGWNPRPGLVGVAHVEPANLILTTTPTDVSGLSMTGTPTGVPMILDIDVVANNGASGGSRFIDLQVYNGATALDSLRRFSLPLVTNVSNVYTINYPIFLTPASSTWTLKAGADQAASVVLVSATLRLSVMP